MKSIILSFFGAIGSGVAFLFGGWDASIITLCIFMAIDYITGVIVAGVFHKSTHSKTGGLESKAGWKGLAKKSVSLLFVVIAVRLDMLVGANYIRDAVCIAFISNELISIIENAGLMGLPIPAIITKAIDILSIKAEDIEEVYSNDGK